MSYKKIRAEAIRRIGRSRSATSLSAPLRCTQIRLWIFSTSFTPIPSCRQVNIINNQLIQMCISIITTFYINKLITPYLLCSHYFKQEYNHFYFFPFSIFIQDYYVVLLSPIELDTTMRMILQVPIWAQRVIYIQGSCLKDADLARARMNEAEACFVLAARNYCDKTAAVSAHLQM